MVGTNSYVAKLKAQLDRAIIQREHWKQLAENRNSILVTEVCPESRSVEEHIIDADSVRASWRLMRGYREHIEALRAENAKLRTALAEQGERQEAVAWALANSADEIGGFAPIYYTKEGAISWANGRNIFPLYTTPQPSQDVRALVSADDVRDACANAVSVFTEVANADQCREVAEYMREVLLAQIAKQQAKGKGGKHE